MTPQERKARLTGALLVVVGAIAFSGKGVIIKLAYRYGVDAVTLLALRMVLSAPFFAVLGWWAARGKDIGALSTADRGSMLVLGLIGYYLASYFDFLGLQYVSVALERLLLFVHPTFVVLLSAALFGRRITPRDVFAIVLSYLGIFVVFGNDSPRSRAMSRWGRSGCSSRRFSMPPTSSVAVGWSAGWEACASPATRGSCRASRW